MSGFLRLLTARIDEYVRLRRSLGYAFRKQAATLRCFLRYVEQDGHGGPLTQDLAVRFVVASGGTANGRARRYGVLRCFADFLSVHDTRTEVLEQRALPRSRATPPPRILDDSEMDRLLSAALRVSPRHPRRGRTLHTVIGLLASTGLRSGEALRLPLCQHA